MSAIRLTNFDFLYDEINHYSLQPYDVDNLKSYFLKKQGWIYISKSKSDPSFKIGRTSKTPWERAKSLSGAGVLNDFEVLFALPVKNSIIVEKYVHNLLKKYRVKSSKEFFLCTLEIAAKAVEEAQMEEKKVLSRTFQDIFFEESISLLTPYWINSLRTDLIDF